MRSNAEVVLAVFRAIEERDREALFELYHDDVELYDAPSLPYGYEGVSGKEAVREQLDTAPETSWLGTWGPPQPTGRERRLDPRIVATDGDEVVVQYVTRAMAPDGERFESPVVAIYEVRDGKFARAQMFHYDTAAILAFLERAGSRGTPRRPRLAASRSLLTWLKSAPTRVPLDLSHHGGIHDQVPEWPDRGHVRLP